MKISLTCFFSTLSFILSLVMVACSSSQDEPQGRGTIMARGEADGGIDSLNITITSTDDGGVVSNFQGSQVNAELPIGKYKIEAWMGDADAEGHGLQYYYDYKEVVIEPDQTTEVKLVAKPQKASITIEPTKAFQSYMTAYSAKVNTLDYNFSTSKPLCVKPGNVVVNVNYTLPTNETGHLQAASFMAAGGTHYTIGLDVNHGEVGQAVLNITFDDEMKQEEVNIII